MFYRNQLSNAIFDSLPKSTMNGEPQNIEGFQGCNQTTEESLQQWQQSTDELLSSLMSHDITFSVTKVIYYLNFIIISSFIEIYLELHHLINILIFM